MMRLASRSDVRFHRDTGLAKGPRKVTERQANNPCVTAFHPHHRSEDRMLNCVCAGLVQWIAGGYVGLNLLDAVFAHRHFNGGHI